jgi:hypothetical protein
MSKVAIARYMGMDQTIQVNGKNYNFANRSGVSICMVDEEDVPAVLALSKICCGGRRRKLFQHANQAQIDFWSRLG